MNIFFNHDKVGMSSYTCGVHASGRRLDLGSFVEDDDDGSADADDDGGGGSDKRWWNTVMAVVTNSSRNRSTMDPQQQHQVSVTENNNRNGEQRCTIDRLKLLYPAVNEDKTPLPRAWSSKEKYNYIGLSQNNLRVHYKGHGKTHRDAASVQATHPIPAACGLYYFEVKIVSKGRDGYMGIGLSAKDVNMNRLPGWDKHSYGYHGDDGHSFCSSGTGQPYGPTFTTGDVIGCGVNLIDNTCFYTKNGHHLGIAFTDLPPNLYPTVGLQTPGEVVDANFGQEPFVFDIEDMVKELRARTRLSIHEFPVPESQGEWQAILHKMVSTYLVHHGYCATAECFAHMTGQPFTEDISSIRNRQKILKLVLAGRMGEAIEMTHRLYPSLLEHNQNLLFMLKCRQFIEMVNGSDSEPCPRRCHPSGLYSGCGGGIGSFSPSSQFSNTSPRPNSPPLQTSVIQSTKTFSHTTNSNSNNNKSKCCYNNTVEELNNQNNVTAVVNGSAPPATNNVTTANSNNSDLIRTTDEDSDVDMDTSDEIQNGHNCTTNGKVSPTTNGYQNGNSHKGFCDGFLKDDEDMDIDEPMCRKSCKPSVEKILEFGRELYNMSQRLKVEQGSNEDNKKMLQNAFSLLAYSNPWQSPVGWQLSPVQRESICASLNSAILESCDLPRRPPLEMAMAHAQELVRLMSTAGLGSCAFADVTDLLEH